MKSLWFGLKLIPRFSPFFEDIQVWVSDSRLDISTNNEPKLDTYISKSKFECWQPETNLTLKIEDTAIVSWLAKRFAFYFYSPGSRKKFESEKNLIKETSSN